MEILEVRQQGHGLRVGIVRCRFNEEVGRALLHACHARLLELGVADEDITLVSVPGALEAPLALQALADSGEFDALIALGAVPGALELPLALQTMPDSEE